MMTLKLCGYTVDLYLGNGNMPEEEKNSFKRSFSLRGIRFLVHGPIFGIEKFDLLNNSRLLFSPSQFEDSGIPILEATYCGLPCVCSDLPVLKEHGKDEFFYKDPRSYKSMRNTILESLKTKISQDYPSSRMTEIAKMDEYGKRLNDIFQKI